MTSLVELIGATVPLKRRGNLHFGRCPFHEDKTASFVVYARPTRAPKPFFRCFGCGERGDAIDWIQRTQNVGYAEAKRILGEPIRPDPIIIAARQARQRRERAIAEYRDKHPHCELAESYNAWLLAT